MLLVLELRSKASHARGPLVRAFFNIYCVDKSLLFVILKSVSGESYSPKTNECPRELRRKADFAFLALLFITPCKKLISCYSYTRTSACFYPRLAAALTLGHLFLE